MPPPPPPPPPLLLLLLVLLICSCIADDSTSQQLLSNINDYRSNLGVPPFSYNPGAACLADKIAEQLEHQDCNNVTEAQTYPGLEPDLPNYTQFLSDCKLNLLNTTDGLILVDCIPAAAKLSSEGPAGTAAENFTRSQEYQSYMNSTSFSTVGIASEDLWFVLVLGSNSSKASYSQTGSSSATRVQGATMAQAAALVTTLLLLVALIPLEL